MKKILVFLLFSIIFTAAWAQSPNLFNYQSVVRDPSGNIVADSPIGLRISILKGSASGSVSYSETHYLSTNAFGLISVKIGAGNTPAGQLDTLDWGNADYFLSTELDITGGANYMLMGVSQLISVPYALYGRDEDFDPGNEIQDIVYSNDTLSISNGSSIPLPLGYLGEIKSFVVSISGAITIAELQARGWAICDGTSPDSQGIVNALLTVTPNMQDRFLKMSTNTSTGNTGGFAEHNHQWQGATNQGSPRSWRADGITQFDNGSTADNGYSRTIVDASQSIYTKNNSSLPPFYEILFFIKVK